MLIRRPSLNKLGAVVSTPYLKMKLPSPTGNMITLRVDQKAARKCYENILKTQRRSYTIVTFKRTPYLEADPRIDQ